MPLLLAGPMVGGLCIFSLKATRGEYVEFGDLFKGLSNFGGFLGAFLAHIHNYGLVGASRALGNDHSSEFTRP